MANDFIRIYSALDSQQAYLLKNLLEDNGVQAFVTNDTLDGARGEVPFGVGAAPQVHVKNGDREKAEQVVAEFDRHNYERAHQADRELERVDTQEVTVVKRPACPNCGADRLGKCSYCGARSANFLKEVTGPTGDDDAVDVQQFICLVCSEPTVPVWDKTCAECQFRFEDA